MDKKGFASPAEEQIFLITYFCGVNDLMRRARGTEII
jgi:hypothetical protein